ncbi:hypothetical protein A1QO_00710 [Vibrio genomosp. F10 str. ZF-129]|uniref:Competence protein n=1 Tax=Vibrio genomosp. F10 str. ZF-129 TaxID=1187848 RepID=A0A1E5BGB0_9VIBR|nr:hypothetical protein [Vibrio genomosp. F10]OEE35313.1 hypothetical protein A1QO_00710 [Vibrio genomosp. F10 str. ZF-129]
MRTTDKHNVWELLVNDISYPIVATHFLNRVGNGIHEKAQSVVKARIAQNPEYVRCSACKCGLVYIAASQNGSAHFRHNLAWADPHHEPKECVFYSQQNEGFHLVDLLGENGQWHLKAKLTLSELLYQSPTVKSASIRVDPYLLSHDDDLNTFRKPDIFFIDILGNKWAIELTRWWMSPKLVQAREHFFREEGINLLWLFSPGCKQNNQTTFYLIMYGSNCKNGVRRRSSSDRPQSNAFIFDDEAIKASRLNNNLSIKVQYPVYTLIGNEISADYKESIVSLAELDTFPTKRLPYAIDTESNLSRVLSAKNNRAIERTKADRKSLYEKIKSVRRAYYQLLAYTGLTVNEQRKVERKMGCFERIPDTYKFKGRLAIMHAQSKFFCNSFEEKRIAAAKRKIKAQKLSRIRTQVIEAKLLLERKLKKQDLDYLKSLLDGLSKSLIDTPNKALESRVHQLRIELRASYQRLSTSPLADAEKMKDYESLLKDLQNDMAFYQIPTNRDELTLRLKRLKDTCAASGKSHLNEVLESEYNLSLARFRNHYLRTHFNFDYETAWTPEHNFHSDLEIIREFLQNSKVLSDEQRVVQKWLFRAVSMFVETIVTAQQRYISDLKGKDALYMQDYRNNRRLGPVKSVRTLEWIDNKKLANLTSVQVQTCHKLKQIVKIT